MQEQFAGGKSLRQNEWAAVYLLQLRGCRRKHVPNQLLTYSHGRLYMSARLLQCFQYRSRLQRTTRDNQP